MTSTNHKPPFCWCHDDTIEPDAAPQEPQEGTESTCTWGELLYELTGGEMGTPPAKPKPPQQ